MPHIELLLPKLSVVQEVIHILSIHNRMKILLAFSSFGCDSLSLVFLRKPYSYPNVLVLLLIPSLFILLDSATELASSFLLARHFNYP